MIWRVSDPPHFGHIVIGSQVYEQPGESIATLHVNSRLTVLSRHSSPTAAWCFGSRLKDRCGVQRSPIDISPVALPCPRPRRTGVDLDWSSCLLSEDQVVCIDEQVQQQDGVSSSAALQAARKSALATSGRSAGVRRARSTRSWSMVTLKRPPRSGCPPLSRLLGGAKPMGRLMRATGPPVASRSLLVIC